MARANIINIKHAKIATYLGGLVISTLLVPMAMEDNDDG